MVVRWRSNSASCSWASCPAFCASSCWRRGSTRSVAWRVDSCDRWAAIRIRRAASRSCSVVTPRSFSRVCRSNSVLAIATSLLSRAVCSVSRDCSTSSWASAASISRIRWRATSPACTKSSSSSRTRGWPSRTVSPGRTAGRGPTTTAVTRAGTSADFRARAVPRPGHCRATGTRCAAKVSTTGRAASGGRDPTCGREAWSNAATATAAPSSTPTTNPRRSSRPTVPGRPP